jgi:hypothetical protein
VCFFCQSESIYFNGWQLSRAGPARVQMFFLCLEELRRRDVTQEPPQKKKKIRLLPSLRELVHYKHFSSSFEPSKKNFRKTMT